MPLLTLLLACGQPLPAGDDPADSAAPPAGCDDPRPYPGDLVLSGADEAELSAWCSRYDRVAGSLTLDGLDSLAGFDCLCAVDGDLTVQGGQLYDLAPLATLGSVGGWIAVADLPVLVSLDGLGSVSGPVKGVFLQNLPALTDVSALAALPSLEEGLMISEAPRLVTLQWSITSASSILLLGTGLPTIDLPQLETLGDLFVERTPLTGLGLPALRSVDGDVHLADLDGGAGGVVPTGPWSLGGTARVWGVRGWEDLAGLGCLAEVGEDLEVDQNPGLRSLDGLGCLTSVGGDLLVSGNKALERVDALGGLIQVDAVEISANEVLGSLEGLSGLEGLAGDLVLRELPALAAVDGLPFLDEVGGRVEIAEVGATAVDLPALERVDEDLTLSGLPGLASLDGLPALRSVGTLSVSDAPALASVGPLPALWDVHALELRTLPALTELSLPAVTALDGGLTVDATGLADLRGLDALTGVATRLVLSGNPSLTSLASLDGLLRVDGDLTVQDNDALPTLDGLGDFGALGGGLRVEGNATLGDITALYTLDRVEGDLAVVDNPILPTAQAETLVEAIGAEDVGGTITISGNAP